MRCAVIQAKIARDHGPQARDGSGRLAEVYPAASLKLWGLLARGYKGRGAPEAERLGLILDTLRRRRPGWTWPGTRTGWPPPTTSSTRVIASLTARAVGLGQTLRPAGGLTPRRP